MRFSLSSLRRSTNAKVFIPEIDGMRFFAIITVVLYHINTAYAWSLGKDTEWSYRMLGEIYDIRTLAWWWTRLDMGVKVFFSISGFVLALPFLKSLLQGAPLISLKDYFLRRLTRLEPPFVLSLLFFYLVHVILLGKNTSELMPSLLAGLLYSHKLAFGESNPINPVTWSLETEAQFYVVVPFLFMLLNRIGKGWHRWAVMILLAIFSMLFRWTAYVNLEAFRHFNLSILAFFVNFGTGILFAWMYLTKSDFLKRKSAYWDLIGLTAVVLMFLAYKPQHWLIRSLLFNSCVLAMMISVFKGPLMNRFFTLPLIYVTGGMCYSIYLIHFAFFFFIMPFTNHFTSGLGYAVDMLLQSAIVLPLLFLVSTLFYLMVEKPCMDKNWPQKLSRYVKCKFLTIVQ